MDANKKSKYLTVDEVAKLVGWKNTKSVDRHIASGSFPGSVIIGNQHMWKRIDVVKWIKERDESRQEKEYAKYETVASNEEVLLKADLTTKKLITVNGSKFKTKFDKGNKVLYAVKRVGFDDCPVTAWLRFKTKVQLSGKTIKEEMINLVKSYALNPVTV